MSDLFLDGHFCTLWDGVKSRITPLYPMHSISEELYVGIDEDTGYIKQGYKFNIIPYEKEWKKWLHLKAYCLSLPPNWNPPSDTFGTQYSESLTYEVLLAPDMEVWVSSYGWVRAACLQEGSCVFVENFSSKNVPAAHCQGEMHESALDALVLEVKWTEKKPTKPYTIMGSLNNYFCNRILIRDGQ